MKVEFIKNWKKGSRVILKGQSVEVTPWLFKELAAGKYVKTVKVIETINDDWKVVKPTKDIKVATVKAETTMKDEIKETR